MSSKKYVTIRDGTAGKSVRITDIGENYVSTRVLFQPKTKEIGDAYKKDIKRLHASRAKILHQKKKEGTELIQDYGRRKVKYRVIKHGKYTVYYTAEWLDGEDWKALTTRDFETICSNEKMIFHNKKEAIKSVKKFLAKMKQRYEDHASEPKIVAKGKI